MTANKWENFPQVGFDLETTGVSVWEDRIVTAALIRFDGVRPTPQTKTYLADPGIDIPAEATAVHGVTTEHAQENGQAPAVVIDDIVTRLHYAMTNQIPVVIANASFDLTMLEVEARRHGIISLAQRMGGSRKIGPVIDPMVLEKYADPYRKVKGGCLCGCGAENKTLTGLTTHYGIKLDAAHTADADALAACLLWPVILHRHKHKFPGQSIGALHTSQIGWSAEQRNSLRAYFDKVGTEHDGVPLGWPLLDPPQLTLDGVA